MSTNDAIELANIISTYEKKKALLQSHLDTLKQLKKSDGVFSIRRFKSFMEKNIDDNIIDSLDVSRATKVLSQQVRFEDALKITIDYTSLYRKKSQELLDLEQSYKESLNTIIPTIEKSHEQPKKKCSFWDWVSNL